MRIITAILVITAALVPLGVSGQDRENKLVQLRSLIVSIRVGDVSRLDGEVLSKQRGETNPHELHVDDKLSQGDPRADW
jgi:hypothetical protein